MRLPKAFRFDADEVRIRRQGNALVFEPTPKDWAWLDTITGPVDDDVISAVNEDVPQQDRPGLDDAFQ